MRSILHPEKILKFEKRVLGSIRIININSKFVFIKLKIVTFIKIVILSYKQPNHWCNKFIKLFIRNGLFSSIFNIEWYKFRKYLNNMFCCWEFIGSISQ